MMGLQVICTPVNYFLMIRNLSNTQSIKQRVRKHVGFYLCQTSKRRMNVSGIPISSKTFQIHLKKEKETLKHFRIICLCSGTDRQKWVGRIMNRKFDNTKTKSRQIKKKRKGKIVLCMIKIKFKNEANGECDIRQTAFPSNVLNSGIHFMMTS